MTIIYIILGLLVLLLGYAATRPATFRLVRSTTIKASPAKIFPLLDDFHRWTAWSPWERLDPNLQRSYSGPASGKGAVYSWEGNKQVGSGRMEITDSVPSSRLNVDLDFLKPFVAHNKVEFTLQPAGDSTNISWAMNGNHNFMFKLMGIFMSMDKMVGNDFEKGLANLKAEAEK